MTALPQTILHLQIPGLDADYCDVDLFVESCLARKQSGPSPAGVDADDVLGSVILKRSGESPGLSRLIAVRGDRHLWELLRIAYLGNLSFRATSRA